MGVSVEMSPWPQRGLGKGGRKKSQKKLGKMQPSKKPSLELRA